MKFNVQSKLLLSRLNAVSKVVSSKNAYAFLACSINVKRFVDKIIRIRRTTCPNKCIISYQFHLSCRCTRFCRIKIIRLITKSFSYR